MVPAEPSEDRGFEIKICSSSVVGRFLFCGYGARSIVLKFQHLIYSSLVDTISGALPLVFFYRLRSYLFHMESTLFSLNSTAWNKDPSKPGFLPYSLSIYFEGKPVQSFSVYLEVSFSN